MPRPKKQEKPEAGASKMNTVITEFSVDRTHEFDDGSVCADLTINGVKIYGVRVVETQRDGKDVEFLSFPSRKGSDGKYYSHVYVPMSDEDQQKIIDAIWKKFE